MYNETLYYLRFRSFYSSTIADFTREKKTPKMCWVKYTGDGISPGNSKDAVEAAASKKLQRFPWQL